jgi:ADP-heptose:LPS heptosyltransferase
MGDVRIDVMHSRRVGVFRALHLGDLLCAIPALRALRRGMPQAEITLIGLGWVRDFVDRFDHYLDGFLEFPGWPGLPEQSFEPGAVTQFLAAAQTCRFDLAIQLHGDGSVTNAPVALTGASCTAGFYAAGAWVPNPSTFIEYPAQESEICRLLRLVEHIGCPPSGSELEFPVRPADRRAMDRLFAANDIPPGPYVCIHPGAHDPRRRWSSAAFAMLADNLAEHGMHVVLTGAACEAHSRRAVAAAMRQPCFDLGGQTELGTLAALLERATLVVCNDTGVSHLAAATTTPSVILFTVSDPFRWAPLDKSHHRAISALTSVDPIAEAIANVRDLLNSYA